MDMWVFDREYHIMSTIGTIFFVIIGVLIIGAIIAGIRQWSRNNNSPRLAVRAKVVNMRGDVSHHHSGINEHSSGHASTSYYVTFEVQSGDRIELHMSGQEYGMLAIGDIGTLTFQGTRYLGFERE